MSTASSTTTATRVIDSHLHVWASSDEASLAFPYAAGQEPPEDLRSAASTAQLLQKMDQAGVDGALIVQPINHKFDHSYVIQAMKDHPTKFKGIMLHDPNMSEQEAVTRLEDLAIKGFVGVRFNPYLWPKNGKNTWTPMSSTQAALGVYKRCADLKCAVGVMCFQGLELHYHDILQLLNASPETIMVLDHFAFTSLSKPESFDLLLSLAKYPQVYVKISALFRQGDQYPYESLKKERLEPLLKAFGSSRLMFGTDFPFVLQQQESYKGTVDTVKSWLSNKDQIAVMGGTAETVFGSWATTSLSDNEL